MKHFFTKTQEELVAVKNMGEFTDTVTGKLEYIARRQEQTERLLGWAKRSEHETVCKTMVEKMSQELEKVAKIANNGYGQVQKNAEKIEKSFENLASKLSANIEVNINDKVEGIEN